MAQATFVGWLPGRHSKWEEVAVLARPKSYPANVSKKYERITRSTNDVSNTTQNRHTQVSQMRQGGELILLRLDQIGDVNGARVVILLDALNQLLTSADGEFHGQTDAKWILIRWSLRGGNEKPCGRPTLRAYLSSLITINITF
jgi:hypothetical protein